MVILNSKIFDIINKILFIIQNKLDNIRRNSFLFSKIDWFIFYSITLLLTVSTFLSTGYIALFALIVPVLVIIKVLITKGEKIELESGNLCLIVYLFICFISNLTSSMPKESFYGFLKTLLYFAFYFGMCQFLKNNKRFIVLILFLIAMLITGESIYGLIQNNIGVANIATWQDTSYVNPENVLTRVYGTLKPYNPNLFAGWLIAGFSSLLGISALCFYKRYIFPSILSIIAILITTLCIFYTGSRGAYIALFAIFFISLLILINLNKICKVIAGLITLMGAIFVTFHNGILNRLMSIFIMRGDSSTSFRLNVYNSALQMFQDNPIWGIGVGNKVFREIYGLYMLSGFDALSCYCVFLEMAVESGVFALIAYLLFLFTLFSSSIKKFLQTQYIVEKILIFTALISVLAVIIHGLVDTVYFRPQIQFLFWTMVAILTSIVRKQNNN